MSKPEKEPRTFIVKRQVDVASFFGVSPGTVKDWTARGMPGSTGAYELSEVAKWLRRSGPWQPNQRLETDDPLLAEGGDSPGLERYRIAKAALAELELAERTGALMSRDKARAFLLRWASVIRRMGEQLGKRFGPDAALSVNHALAECQYVIDHELGDPESTDDGPSE